MSSDAVIRIVMKPVKQEDFSASVRKCLERLGKHIDLLAIEQHLLDRRLRARHIRGCIERLDGRAARPHLSQMIERQVAGRAEQEGSRVIDRLCDRRMGDAEIAFLCQVGGRLPASDEARKPADQCRLMFTIELFNVRRRHVAIPLPERRTYTNHPEADHVRRPDSLDETFDSTGASSFSPHKRTRRVSASALLRDIGPFQVTQVG